MFICKYLSSRRHEQVCFVQGSDQNTTFGSRMFAVVIYTLNVQV